MKYSTAFTLLARSMAPVLIAGASGCAMEPASVDEGVQLATTSEEIAGGGTVASNAFNAMVYIFAADGIWHVCSGSIIGTSNGAAYVATAFHCVDLALTPGDPVYYRLTTEKTPGRPVTPPPSWVKPLAVYHPANAAAETPRDFAIIVVPDNAAFRSGLAASSPAARPGLFLGNPADQIGRLTRMYGYGCNTENPTAAGFGVLRAVGGLTIMPQTGPGYMNWDSNPSGMGSGGTCGGDSGGPNTRIFSYSGAAGGTFNWLIQLGTHSSGVVDVGFDVASPMIPEFLQTTIGRLYASSFVASGRFLRRSSETNGSTVIASSALSDGPSKWLYNFSSKQLAWGSLCLVGSTIQDRAVTVATCSTSSLQQWSHTKDLQLRNMGSGKCAAYTTSMVVNRTCAAVAEQAWAFRGSP